MVEKGTGSNRHMEQDGYRSSIIPPELIESLLMKDEQDQLSSYKSELETLNAQLDEIKESYSSSESEDSMLDDYMKDDSDELDRKKMKAGLKSLPKDSSVYAALKKLEELYTAIGNKNKQIKASQCELKEKVESRIDTLSDEEIDRLVCIKWFGRLLTLAENTLKKPLNDELDDLSFLIDKYALTLSDYDNQIQIMNDEISKFMNEMERVDE